jgi:hypothetical protein
MELDATGKPSNASKYAHRRYGNEDAAFERVNTLKAYGIWPGVVRYRDGKFGLTYDPTPSLIDLRRTAD